MAVAAEFVKKQKTAMDSIKRSPFFYFVISQSIGVWPVSSKNSLVFEK